MNSVKYVSSVSVDNISRKNKGLNATGSAVSGSDISDTVHYITPASLTATSLHGEDDSPRTVPPSPEFLRYLQAASAGHIGEYTPVSAASSLTLTAELKLPQLERTLAIIKPQAVMYEDVVVRKILQAGFKILQKRKLHLTPEQVSELYGQYYGQLIFPYMVVNMSLGPVIVMCLAAADAVAKWKAIVKNSGTLHQSWFFPTSIKLRFGVMETMDDVLHASEDIRGANREIRYFFPQMILEPLLRKEPEVTDFLTQYVNTTLLEGLTELCKKKPIEPILCLAEWLLLNNPYQPKMDPEIAKLPT